MKIILAIFLAVVAFFFYSKGTTSLIKGKADSDKFAAMCVIPKDTKLQMKECLDFYNNDASRIFRSNEQSAFLVGIGGVDSFKRYYFELEKILNTSPLLKALPEPDWKLKKISEITNDQVTQ